MPELPEVEHARNVAASVARGRIITRVQCADDPIVFDSTSPRIWQRALTKRRVVGAGRRGKYMWLELDRTPWPVIHLGMAGAIRVPGRAPMKLASSGSRDDDTWPPRFTKLRLRFDDGGELVMTDKRRLGRLRLRDDVLHEPPVSDLGFDPLLDMPGAGTFSTRLRARRSPVKAVLLDQTFAAGIGNWLADEILYQAKIDPRRRANDLSDAEARRVRSAMQRIVARAVGVDADKSRFPKTWLFHHRWGKNSEAVTARGERINHITLAGRTTAWVPEVQA